MPIGNSEPIIIRDAQPILIDDTSVTTAIESTQELEDRTIEYYKTLRIRKMDPLINIDLDARKLYLEVDGVDFWNRADCDVANYVKVVPDWQEQMLNIIQTYKDLGWYKYSMHPSSYFVVNGKLKSINYFKISNQLHRNEFIFPIGFSVF